MGSWDYRNTWTWVKTLQKRENKESKAKLLFFFLKKGKMVKPRKEETGKVNPGKALLY